MPTSRASHGMREKTEALVNAMPCSGSRAEASGVRPAGLGGRCATRPSPTSPVDVAPLPTLRVFGAFDGVLPEELEAASLGRRAVSAAALRRLPLKYPPARRSSRLRLPAATEPVAPLPVLVTLGATPWMFVGGFALGLASPWWATQAIGSRASGESRLGTSPVIQRSLRPFQHSLLWCRSVSRREESLLGAR